jgi:hypothetical protein
MTTTSPIETTAIERLYDEAMANIAEMTAPFAKPDLSEPWPETEEIDVALIEPPVPTRVPHPAPASAGLPVPRRAWVRWLFFRSLGVVAAG